MATLRALPGLAALCLPGLLLGQADPPPVPATHPAAATTSRPDPAAQARALFRELLNTPRDLTQADTDRLRALLADLASPSWQAREQAARQLEQMPLAAATLIEPAAGSSDLEVAVRAKAILQAVNLRAIAGDPRLLEAIEARFAADDTAMVGDLIGLLEHPSVGVRHTAEYALRRLTGQTIEHYSASAEPAARQEAVRKIRLWWQQGRPKFRFAEAVTGPMALLVVDYSARAITAVRPDGTVLWTRTTTLPPYCAYPTGNGNLLVGYAGSRPALEEIAPDGKVVWAGGALAAANIRVQDVRRLPNGNTLLVDGVGLRVIEVTLDGKIVWETGPLRFPMCAERLPNGNTLVADHSGQCVVEVDRAGKTVWGVRGLSYPFDATELPNGNVLVTEFNAQRVLEVDRAGKPLWQRRCPGNPSGAVRLPDGTTVIAARQEGVIVVDREGKVLRRLLEPRLSVLRVRLVPESSLVGKPVAGSP